jgi:hypothetical protein
MNWQISFLRKVTYNSIAALICILIMNVNASAAGLATVDTNYINDHIGGRATGMAGAYAAISDDPSGAWYNPAGIIFASDNQISLSVNNIKGRSIVYDKVVFGEDYKQNIFSIYPSFFGVVQSIGGFKIAFTLMNINNDILDQDSHFVGQNFSFDFNYNITDSTIPMGISVAHFVTNNISAGVSVYGFWRHRKEISNQTVVRFADDFYYLNNQYITEDIWGYIVKAGLQWMPTNYMSIGASYTYSGIASYNYKSQSFVRDFAATNVWGTTSGVAITKGSYTDAKIPMILRAGAAYFPSKSFIVSADIIANIGDLNYRTVAENTINGAIGLEYFVTDSFPIRTGFFTNFSNTPKINPSSTDQDLHVDLYGVSLGIGWETKNSSISICGYYMFGDGEAQAYTGTTDVQKVHISAYNIGLTGSAKY